MQIFELVGKMTIDGLDKSKRELGDLEKKTQRVQKGMKVMGAAFTAVGVAGLALIQSTKKMNAQLGVTALNLGISTKEMRKLALETTNVTFPLDEVTATFDLLARAGVKDQKVLKDTATAFDTLGDATGKSASEVTRMMIPAMKTFGLTAEQMAKKTDIMTYMSRESTMSMEDFNTMVGYTTPQLVEQGLTIEDLTAGLIYMERQGYAPGRVMTREFMKATTLAQKEQISLTEALGMTTEETEALKNELEGATGMTQKYADVANEQYTIMDKLKQKFSEITLGMSGFLEPLEPVLAGMTALGPIMLIVGTNTKIATLAVRLFGVAWKVALGPIGWAIAAVGLLVGAGIALWKNWDKVQVFFKKLWANMKIIFGKGIKFIVSTVLKPFLLYIEYYLGNIVSIIGKVVGIFNKDWGAAIENVSTQMKNLDQTLMDWADTVIASGEDSKKAREKMSLAAQAAADSEVALAKAEEMAAKAAEVAAEKARKLAEQYGDYIGSIEKLIEAEEIAQTEAGKLNVSMDDLRQHMIATGRATELLALSQEDWIRIGEDANEFARHFAITLEDLAKTSERTTDDMLRDIRDLTGRMKDYEREATRERIDGINDRMKAHREAHRERMDDLQEEYNETIKTIDAELAYALEGYRSQIEAIDRQIEGIEDAEQGRRDAERKAELETSISEELDADKRLDLERRLNELIIESDTDLWKDERELAYETRIAEEKDADERRRLEQRLADFLLEVQAIRTRAQLELDRATLRQEMDMAREEANNAKDQAQEAYDYERDLREQELEDYVRHWEDVKDGLDRQLERALQRYDDDENAFRAMLGEEILEMEDFVKAYNALLDEMKDKTITLTTIQETIGAPPAARAGPERKDVPSEIYGGIGVGEEVGDTGFRYWGTTPEGTEVVSKEPPETYEPWEWLMQKGGIAMRETVARIGEQAPRIPEAVIPLSREVLEKLGLGGGKFKTANIYIYLDGRIIAQAIGEPLVDEIRLRTGIRI